MIPLVALNTDCSLITDSRPYRASGGLSGPGTPFSLLPACLSDVLHGGFEMPPLPISVRLHMC